VSVSTIGGRGGVLISAYSLVFYSTCIAGAVVPLLPAYSTRFELSTLQTGFILASVNLTLTLVAVPVGRLADRVDYRKLSIAAGLVFAVSALGQGTAGDYAVFLTSWILFGVGFALVVTGSLAWLAEIDSSKTRTPVLGGVATVTGLGIIVGPLYGSLLGSRFGLGSPFLFASIAALGVTALVYVAAPDSARDPTRRSGGSGVRRLIRQPESACALVLVASLGLASGVLYLVVPLELAKSGFSVPDIGLVLTLSSILYLAANAATVALSPRISLLNLAVIALLGQAVLLVLPILYGSATALVIFMLGRAPFWALASTITYPLTANGAHLSRLGQGEVFGYLNLVWGGSAALGPLIAGWFLASAGARATLVFLAIGLAAGSAMAYRLLLSTRAMARLA
jgi:DHA1 family solute carrier family 18 vesicular amine transporter 1/2